MNWLKAGVFHPVELIPASLGGALPVLFLGAGPVEMEGAAVAQVAKAFGVPAIVIRSLSDLAGADSHLDFGKFVTAVAPTAAKVVERLVPVLD